MKIETAVVLTSSKEEKEALKDFVKTLERYCTMHDCDSSCCFCDFCEEKDWSDETPAGIVDRLLTILDI